MCLVSVKMAWKILRLSDVECLAKTYLDAWKSRKVCCSHENCCPKRLLFSSEGLTHHYRIQHSRDCVCGNGRMKQGNMLRKLMADESLNNFAILSKKRQEQVSFFNVCLLGELNNFFREIVVKSKLKS